MNENFQITGISHVLLVGKEQYPEPKTTFRSPLRHNELIFNLSGSGIVRFNGLTLENTPGSIRFLPQGPNREYVVERAVPGACIDVFFDTDVPLSDHAQMISVEDPNRMGSLFQKLFAVWVAKSPGYYFECMSLLYRIFSELQQQHRLPEKQYLVIQPAIQYMEAHFLDEKLPVETLAAQCAISYSYLKRLFISKFGVSPKRYIIRLRMNYACDLLKTGLYSVSQVSELCGFSDIYFFSRQFKDYVGLPPSEYQKLQLCQQ